MPCRVRLAAVSSVNRIFSNFSARDAQHQTINSSWSCISFALASQLQHGGALQRHHISVGQAAGAIEPGLSA